MSEDLEGEDGLIVPLTKTLRTVYGFRTNTNTEEKSGVGESASTCQLQDTTIRQEPESVLSRISTHKQSCHRLPRFLSMITSAHPAGVNVDLVG